MKAPVSSTVPRVLHVIPLIAAGSVGYVLFAPGAVPDVLTGRFGISYTAFGLLTSAPLFSIVLAQVPSSYLTARYSTTRVLLVVTTLHVVSTIAIDIANSFLTLLVLRTVWGLAGGTILTVGATHITRLNQGTNSARQQGLYGGMLTLGGAVAFYLAPSLLRDIGLVGLHSPGAIFAIFVIVACWQYRHEEVTTPLTETERDRNDRVAIRPVLTHPVVLVAAFCYIASLGSYVTLSTFITAYFDALGITGPLNVIVLLVATFGRAGGGVTVAYWGLPDQTIIAAGMATATLGFGALAVSKSSVIAMFFPLLAMIAVSFPFGAIYSLATNARINEGSALAIVIAAGNLAALVLPAIIGAIRETTGEYNSGFILLGGINALAIAGIVWLQRSRDLV